METRNNKYKIEYEIDNLRICIALYGGFFFHESATAPTHSHNRYEFHLMLEGESTIITDSKTVSLQQAQGCIIAPNVIHSCVAGEEKHKKTTFSFYFERTKRKSENDLFGKIQTVFGDIDEIVKLENADKYVADISEIVSIFYSKREFTETRKKILFAQLIFSLAEELSTSYSENAVAVVDSNTDRGDRNIRRIMIEEYVNENFNRQITLKELAGILYLSEKQTERLFTREMGTTFKQFVLKIRLKAAMSYLRRTDLSVKNISAMVGYDSYNGFHKAFSAYVGMSPSEYRMKNKK